MGSSSARRTGASGRGVRFGLLTRVAVLLTIGSCGAGVAVAGTIRGSVKCRGVADCSGAVVYVDRIAEKVFPPGPEVVVDQERLRFMPHVLTVLIGTPVVFVNSDDVWHNVFSVSEAKQFNLGTNARGTRRRLVFEKPGVVELLCNVHAEMSAYILVTETPYVAMVGPNGSYVLDQVPAGTYTVVAWREELEIDRRQVTVLEGAPVQVDFDLRR